MTETEKELKDAVLTGLKEVMENGCEDIFRKWVERHQKCVDCGGEYFEKL